MFQFLLRVSDRIRHNRRKRTWTRERATGRRGEDLAHRYLRRKGYTILARNFRTRSGASEIDIVARRHETVVFVEVKTRHSVTYGPPDRAIDEEKRRHMFRGAGEYVRRTRLKWSQVRFDIINVVLRDQPEITHFEDVFPITRSD